MTKYVLGALVLFAACGRPDPSSEARHVPPNAAVHSALSRDLSSVTVTTGPLGRRADLGGTHQSAVVARRAADGTLTTECFDDAAAAEAFMERAGAAASTTAELQ